jgi:alkanesulfonate monooxygenase SsuD/methylene tetrahydromethanopterin reductase-like flavin-dependent oxidoreductase (luciferase family)
MAKLGIMIEGQEGLTWNLWRGICRDVEQLGFDSLRRSDHLFSVVGVSERESLECWVSLGLAAEWTERIEFGPMVSPMTFRPPAILAKMAAAVDQLSGGRLILGVGAGWNESEHQTFGIPFPPLKERFDNLEAGIVRIRETWRMNSPRPVRDGSMPLLIGGSGERRTLAIAAREAAEWNFTGLDVESYKAKAAVLAEHCSRVARDPATLRHSMMTGHLVGRDEKELRQRAQRMSNVIPRFEGMEPDQVLEALRRGTWMVGTPDEVAEKMLAYSAAGVDLFMLQHYLMDDSDALELLAGEVIPVVARP